MQGFELVGCKVSSSWCGGAGIPLVGEANTGNTAFEGPFLMWFPALCT